MGTGPRRTPFPGPVGGPVGGGVTGTLNNRTSATLREHQGLRPQRGHSGTQEGVHIDLQSDHHASTTHKTRSWGSQQLPLDSPCLEFDANTTWWLGGIETFHACDQQGASAAQTAPSPLPSDRPGVGCGPHLKKSRSRVGEKNRLLPHRIWD